MSWSATIRVLALVALAARSAHGYSSMLMNKRCDEWLEPEMRIMGGPAERTSLRRVSLRHSESKQSVACGATVRADDTFDVLLSPPAGLRFAYMEHLLQARGGTLHGDFVGCEGRRAAGAVESDRKVLEFHTLSIDRDAERVVVVGAWQRQMAAVYLTDECVLHVAEPRAAASEL